MTPAPELPAPPMHWSRWGSPEHAADLPESARALIESFFGELHPQPAVGIDDVRVPTVMLGGERLEELAAIVGAEHVCTDAEPRVRRTRGKSTPDLLKIRAGDGSDAPDVVVRPGTHQEVSQILAWAGEHHVAVVPFGGGTSVVGGLAAEREGYAGVISLDLTRMKRLVAVDPISRTATLEAGLLGPEAEALLAEHGLTIGHHPQSFEYASIGGFAVTRSSGQASAGYGRFDALVVGLRTATPIGDLVLGTAPSNAAGPDLRELVMGSEGAFGVVTEVTVRVRPLPSVRTYETWRFQTFTAGAEAMRALAQSGLAPTVLRLSDEMETAVNLAKPEEVGGSTGGGCLMVVGFEGDQRAVDVRRTHATGVLLESGGESLGEEGGQAWAAGRYHGPYLRDSLLDVGVLVETLETATFWSNLHRLYADVKAALESSLTDQGTPAVVLCHISHVYENGASLYFTVACKQTDDPVAQWRSAKAAASDAMIAAGATITHHHAVGRDHKPWLAEEIGPVGVAILRAVKERVDPRGVLNPGVLIP